MFPESILIVDDCTKDRERIAKMVAEICSGASIHLQYAPDRVYSDIATYAPDVIIIDLLLGFMNGLKVLRFLRKRNILIPAIIVADEAGDYDDLIQNVVPRNNVAGVAIKPIDINKLEQLLRKCGTLTNSREMA